MLIGTAGHIDHGKTALIRALTGVDTTHLPEERKRGITIELGYAYVPVAENDQRMLAFVDVPGHEKFIPIMLTGAAGIDFALLVVAVDDGPMPQTLEHLAILQLLGVSRGAVALTKCDRVDGDRIDAVAAETAAILSDTPLTGIPFFRTSASTGMGIALLRKYLCEVVRNEQSRREDGAFRLAVDRHFAVTGAGTVVTGTVYAGAVHNGDRLVLARGDGFMREVRVRGLHVSNRVTDSGHAGTRCAVNLVGIEHRDVQRGDWLCAPELARSTERLDMRLCLLSHAERPIRQWQGVHLHHAAGQTQAHIALLDDALESGGLVPGGSALVQAVLETPILACWGDRIVIRDAAGRMTLGGGQVLDPFPPARHRRRPARLTLLAALEEITMESRLKALLDASPLGVDGNDLAAAHNITIDHWLHAMPDEHVVHVRGAKGSRLFSPAHWRELGESIVSRLISHHEQYADEPGVERERLRRMCFPQLPSWVFLACLENLLQTGRLFRSGSAWHLPEYRIELSASDRARADTLLTLLDEGRFDPPWVRELADLTNIGETDVRRLLRGIAACGEAFQVVRDLFYSAGRIAELAEIVADIAGSPFGRSSNGSLEPVHAAVFRDRIGCGRKRAIQILEFFDRVGYTRRVGTGNQRAHLIRGEPPAIVESATSVVQR